jgi:hypothetical protein
VPVRSGTHVAMEDAHAKTVEEVLNYFNVDPERGLTPDQIKRNQEKYGPNGKWKIDIFLNIGVIYCMLIEDRFSKTSIIRKGYQRWGLLWLQEFIGLVKFSLHPVSHLPAGFDISTLTLNIL